MSDKSFEEMLEEAPEPKEEKGDKSYRMKLGGREARRAISGDHHEDFEAVDERFIEEQRWVNLYDGIIRRRSDDTLWRLRFNVGKTEMQDYSTFDQDEVEFQQVRAVPSSTIEYASMGYNERTEEENAERRVKEILRHVNTSDEVLEELTLLTEDNYKKASGVDKHRWQALRLAVDGLRSIRVVNGG